jgi:hypothetical protein
VFVVVHPFGPEVAPVVPELKFSEKTVGDKDTKLEFEVRFTLVPSQIVNEVNVLAKAFTVGAGITTMTTL